VLSWAGSPVRDDTPGQGYWEKENTGVGLALANLGLIWLSLVYLSLPSMKNSIEFDYMNRCLYASKADDYQY